MPTLVRFRSVLAVSAVLTFAAAGVLTLAAAGCSTAESPDELSTADGPVQLSVRNVTTTAGSQPLARTVTFGPSFELIPQVESLTPQDGYVFLLFELEATNHGTAAVSFEAVDLTLEGTGLFGGDSTLWYLLRPAGGEPTYISIGKDVGIKPRQDLEPGASVTWQLLATVEEGSEAFELGHPQASPVEIRL